MRSQRWFYAGKRSYYFQRLNWGKVSPQRPSLLIPYSENYIRPLERQRGRKRVCQQRAGKLEGDKVFTSFNNIKHVQEKYIIAAAFGNENSPWIIFFKLSVNM